VWFLRVVKIMVSIVATILISIALVGNNHALAASKTDQLVNDAIKAGKSLTNATRVEYKATGKNVPTKEYNSAVKKYNTAKSAVNKQSAKLKKANLSKLNGVHITIDRGKKYIDAVTYGKKISSKKATLDKYVKNGNMDSKTVGAYTDLSSTLTKYSSKFDLVYGRKTRDKIKALYQTPAKKVVDELKYPVVVKQAITETSKLVKTSSSSDKLADQYKKSVYYIDSIKQSNYKKQLKTELATLTLSVPSKLHAGQFGKLLTMEIQFEELDHLVFKGKSDEKVPTIYQSLSTTINGYNPKAERSLLQNRFNSIMDRLKVSIQELKGMLTDAAIAKGVPPEIVKSIAVTENGKLQQFQVNGDVFKSPDNGYGIMQVTPASEQDQRYDWNRVKYDIRYNIEVGVEILLEKWKYATGSNPILPLINDGNPNVLENWYFAIWAYNGLSFKNDPNTQPNPYQEKVYENLINRTLMDPVILSKNETIIMMEDPMTHLPSFTSHMTYSTNKQTKTTQTFKKNDQVTISSKSKFRTAPTTVKNTPRSFPAGTLVTILSGPIEDDNAANLFSWYKVQIKGVKGIWYVASSNLQ
jgi:hypothetical protein